MTTIRPLLLIILVYLGIGSLYAVQVPDWQAPDEPAHYNYVRQLANGRFPIMQSSDYDEAYKNEVVGSQFAPQYDVSIISYEDWQPPLYYLLLTPIYKLADGSLTALRLATLLIGMGVVLYAYAIAKQLYPEQRWIWESAAVFVAFLPQHLSIMASMNNDSLSELIIAAVLYRLIWWTKLSVTVTHPTTEKWRMLSISILLGLGLLTKLTTYLLVPIVGIIFLYRYWPHQDWGKGTQSADDFFIRPRKNHRGTRRKTREKLWEAERLHRFIRAGFTLFLPATLLGLLWWGRNVIVYPGFDPLARLAHDTAVIGQPRTAEWIAQQGLPETIRQFLQTTFNSFWGQFGWMGVVMDSRIYQTLLLFSGIILAGLLINWFTSHRSPLTTPHFMLFLLFGLTLGMHIFYNLTFVQHQGRYLFPALIPIGIGTAVSLNSWLTWLQKSFQLQLNNLLPLVFGIGLAGLDLFALYRFILPQLT